MNKKEIKRLQNTGKESDMAKVKNEPLICVADKCLKFQSEDGEFCDEHIK